MWRECSDCVCVIVTLVTAHSARYLTAIRAESQEGQLNWKQTYLSHVTLHLTLKPRFDQLPRRACRYLLLIPNTIRGFHTLRRRVTILQRRLSCRLPIFWKTNNRLYISNIRTLLLTYTHIL